PSGGGSHTASTVVTRFDPDGTATTLPLRYGSKPGQIDPNFSAEGIDVDPTGNVWINDRPNRRVQAFTPGGRYILGCGSPRAGLFGNGVGDIAIAPSGAVYV